jgi:hypothetical protein
LRCHARPDHDHPCPPQGIAPPWPIERV